MITFRDIRPYISKIDRVSICNQDTLQYENYMFISDVPEKYDHMYLYGIGRIQSEFPASQAPDVVAKMMVAGEEKPADESFLLECLYRHLYSLEKFSQEPSFRLLRSSIFSAVSVLLLWRYKRCCAL